MKGETLLWLRLACQMQEPDVDALKEKVTSEQFVDWNVYLDQLAWRHRDKTEHYFAALRFDLHHLIYLFRRFMGSDPPEPELEKMFLNFGKEGEPDKKGFRVPPHQPAGHGYLMEGDNGDHEKGYGLPGVEVGVTPLSPQWQRINDEEKAKWAGIMPSGRISYTPPDGATHGDNPDQRPAT